jgi:hypothetical protein
MRAARGRPMGEVASALLSAAARGPGTVVQLAERACVGYDKARWKTSALVRSGMLTPLSDVRPRVLAASAAGLSAADPYPAGPAAPHLQALPPGFWQHVTSAKLDAADDAEGDAMT